MKRETFLLITAVLAALFGIFFIFLTPLAVSQFITDQGGSVLMLERSVGISLLSIGLRNYFARKRTDTLALKAIMAGTVFLLFGSVVIEIYAVMNGDFTAQVWGGVIAKLLMAIGYLYYLGKFRLVQ